MIQLLLEHIKLDRVPKGTVMAVFGPNSFMWKTHAKELTKFLEVLSDHNFDLRFLDQTHAPRPEKRDSLSSYEDCQFTVCASKHETLPQSPGRIDSTATKPQEEQEHRNPDNEAKVLTKAANPLVSSDRSTASQRHVSKYLIWPGKVFKGGKSKEKMGSQSCEG